MTVLDATTGVSTTIPVGDGPAFIAVNPDTNRVYVNSTRAATLTVINDAPIRPHRQRSRSNPTRWR